MIARCTKGFLAVSKDAEITVTLRVNQKWNVYAHADKTNDTIAISRQNVRIKMDKNTFHTHFEIL